MLRWITHNRLYDLAHQGRRLTPWWALLPLAWLMLLFSQLLSLPLMLLRPGHEDLAGGQPAALSGLLQGLTLTLAFGGMILLVWLWVRLYEKRGLATVGLEREGVLRRYGRGLLIGLLTFAGAVGLMALFGFVAPEASDPGRVGLAALGGVLLVIPGWLVQGAAEEVLTRGWIMPALAARYRPWLGILASSLFFTLAHGLNPNLTVLALVNLFLYGLFAAVYALREGSLWGVCAFHSAWNWAQGNLFGLAVSGNQADGGMLFDLMETGPDWFTGGAFGPEGGLAVTLMLGIGMGIMLLRPRVDRRTRQQLLTALVLLLPMWGAADANAPAAPSALQIVNVQANATTVGLYEKFELTFDINGSVATNPYFPYDPAPPSPVPAGVGITVDALFSPDNWTTVITQPAFLYQPYERRCIYDHAPVTPCPPEGEEWLYPTGDPVWTVRFAPQQTGTWRYRVRATDASGTAQSAEGTFTVVPSTLPHNHGFVRVSPTDPGYFEYSDGTPFIGVGHGEGFSGWRFTYDAEDTLARLEAGRVNFVRVWMIGSSIFMAPWNPWHSHHLAGEGGYFNAVSLTYTHAYTGHLVSLRLWDYPDPSMEGRRNPCMFQGFTNNVAVRPDTAYHLSVRLKTVGVSGPRDSRYPYGFAVRTGGWLGEACADPASTGGDSRLLLGHVNGTTAGWVTVTATFTTGPDEYFLDNFYLILENTTGGDAYVDEVSLRELHNGAPVGPEVLRKNRFAYHLYFDQQPSWQWDYLFWRAEGGEVTIRPVVLEKNDWIANHLDANGNPVGGYYDLDNNRFYAAPDTAVRRLHEYFWRYLIARWGYSRAVHSWELMNEGDPYNGNHYAMADAFGRFMHANDPHRHPVTTSNWHSFPQAEFWANPQYSGVDYADIHEYACCGNRYAGWAQNIGAPLAFEDRPAYVVGGRGHSVRIPGATQFNNAGNTPRHLIIRGPGEWVIRYGMKAENFTGTCEFGLPNSLAGPRLLWILDGTQSSVVPPPAEEGKSWLCTAPAGSYNWRTFDSRTTHDGQPAPASERIILSDDEVHTLEIAFQNGFGTGGQAWIDNVELIAPDGRRAYLNGDFDLTSVISDSAHLDAALSLQIGGRALTGPRRPVTRGEVAIGDNDDYRGDDQHDQRNDTQGVWLHNFLWAQVNPGGLYELYWDATNIRRYDLYFHFRAFRDFMDGIPLNNGHYEDARATASHPDLLVLGQADRVAGRGHLWIRHRQYTWRNVVDGVTIPPLSGQIAVPDLVTGTYRVTWWDTWAGTPTASQLVTTSGPTLTVSLPAPLATDVALQWERVYPYRVFLPLILR